MVSSGQSRIRLLGVPTCIHILLVLWFSAIVVFPRFHTLVVPAGRKSISCTVGLIGSPIGRSPTDHYVEHWLGKQGMAFVVSWQHHQRDRRSVLSRRGKEDFSRCGNGYVMVSAATHYKPTVPGPWCGIKQGYTRPLGGMTVAFHRLHRDHAGAIVEAPTFGRAGACPCLPMV